MLRRVALVRTDVSGEVSSSELSVLTRATRRNIPEEGNVHNYYHHDLLAGLISGPKKDVIFSSETSV
jgi:hypothetical protein